MLPVLQGFNKPHAAIIRFLLLTLARLSEAAASKWRDIDFVARTWNIPETKNGQIHVIPLSRQAVDLLDALAPPTGKSDALVFGTKIGTRLGN